MAPVAYEKVLARVQKPLHAASQELVQLWRVLGLPAEFASERVAEILADVQKCADVVLERERQIVAEAKEELAKATEDVKKLASEVGEEARLPEAGGLLEQVQELQSEFSRLETFRERRAEEIREMTAKIERECLRLGVDPADYKVDGELAGAAGVRAAKMGLQRLDRVQDERIAEVGQLRGRIKAMAEKLGSALEFRMAHDGEMTGCEDGTVVLSSNEANRRFLQELREFEGAEAREVLSSSRFVDHLRRQVAEHMAVLKEDGSSPVRPPRGSARKSARAEPPAAPREGRAAPSDRGGHRQTGRSRSRTQRRRGAGGRARRDEPRRDEPRRDEPAAPPPEAEGGGRARARGGREEPRGDPGQQRQRARRSLGTTTTVPTRSPSGPAPSGTPRRGGGEGADEDRVRAALRAMRGQWEDSSGTLYDVEGAEATRSDGRVFPLGNFLSEGIIAWGNSGSFYAEPSAGLKDKVEWIDARTRIEAFAWTRPRAAPAAAGRPSSPPPRGSRQRRGEQ